MIHPRLYASYSIQKTIKVTDTNLPPHYLSERLSAQPRSEMERLWDYLIFFLRRGEAERAKRRLGGNQVLLRER